MTFRSLHILRSANTLKNGSKSCLTFEYCFPTSLLMSYVETIFKHRSGEVGRRGIRLNRILICILGEINV